MSNVVWMLIDKTLLDSLWPDRNGTALDQGMRGFWKDVGIYEVVNVIDEGKLDQFITDNAADIFATYGWTQGNGLDNSIPADGYPTDPQGVLNVMKDHVIYDEDGNVVSITPATFDNANWGQRFAGQGVPGTDQAQVFAGEYSLEFSEEFF